MSFTKHSIKCLTIYFNALFAFIVLLTIICFARPNTICSGKEFNKRVKQLVDGGDVAVDYKVINFERGNNPPADSDFYVDVSEDRDESVIVYYISTDPNDKEMKRVNLYWYATDTIHMNENLALMFQGFANIKHIDLTGFSYFYGLNDLRYMFKDCKNLKSLHFLSNSYNPANGNLFTPTELQGMFYNCESIQNIDLSKFNTYLVTNMSDMFCKCFNLRNIYVNNPNWNIISVTNFNRMFTDCHLLRSIQGKKAVDIADDDYEKFAGLSANGSDSFLKDLNGSYTDYVPADEYVPLEAQGYLMGDLPDVMEEYYDEPEYDGQGTDNVQNNTGYVDGETGVVVDTSTTLSSQEVTNSSSSNDISYSANSTAEAMQMLDNVTSANEILQDNSVITESESFEITETVEEGSGKKIVELDEYLNASGNTNKQNKNIIEVLWEDYQPLVVTLLIAIFVLLLLIGMVLYLYKEKKNTKNSDKGI